MNSRNAVNKEPLKFKWSHHHPLHIRIVKIINRLARSVPWSIKYRIVKMVNKNSFPYRLLKSGNVVVQIGAPVDTMMTGRSRAIQFADRVGSNGKVVVIEPDENSLKKIESLRRKGMYEQIIFENIGGWSQKDELELYIDDEHPASNFTGQARQYEDDVMSGYRRVSMPVDSVDNIVEKHNLEVDLVSVTTNGAEPQIIDGMERLISRGLKYVCLARTGTGYHEKMESIGFELLAYDDRGYTYVKSTGQSRQLS